MLKAEINSKVANSSRGNLVATGIVNGKRANIFVGNGFKEGDTVNGDAYVEVNEKFPETVNAKTGVATPNYNYVMMVSTVSLQNELIRARITAAQNVDALEVTA